MATPLKNTVALITGSSSGIGAATARRLAAEGAAVALVARRRDRLAELAEAIRGDGGIALVVEADMTSEEEATGAVERTVAKLGRLDTLVNNAGVMLLGPAMDAPLAEWDEMVAINVQGMLYVTHAALPHLARAASDSPRGVADLVSISSTAGRAASRISSRRCEASSVATVPGSTTLTRTRCASISWRSASENALTPNLERL